MDLNANIFIKKFKELDVGKDGNLERDVVASIIDSEGTELEKLMVSLLFEKYDANGDDRIQLSEYLEFCNQMQQLSPEEILRQIFDFFDKDKNGKLDIEEVVQLGRLMGKNVTRADAIATIKAFDTNNDNLIDFDEFLGVIRTIPE